MENYENYSKEEFKDIVDLQNEYNKKFVLINELVSKQLNDLETKITNILGKKVEDITDNDSCLKKVPSELVEQYSAIIDIKELQLDLAEVVLKFCSKRNRTMYNKLYK